MIRRRCQKCPAWIFLVPTVKGGMMPIDVDPVEDGNVAIVAGVAVVLPKAKAPPPPDPQASLFGDRPAEPPPPRPPGPYYVSHYVTCPRAHEFRKRTPEGGGTGRRVRSPGGAGPANARRSRRRRLGR